MRPQPRSYIPQHGPDEKEGRFDHEPVHEAEALRREPVIGATVWTPALLTRMSASSDRSSSASVGEVHDPRLTAEALRHLVRGVAVEVGDDQVRAARGELLGAREADAARAAGHDGATPGEVLFSHGPVLSPRAASALRMKRIMPSMTASGIAAGAALIVALPQQEAHADQLTGAHEGPRGHLRVETGIDVAGCLGGAQPGFVASTMRV
jgi:hypothetical protein